MSRSKLERPNKHVLQSIYNDKKSIKLSARFCDVSYETFRSWLIAEGIEIAPQGHRRNKRGWK